MVLRNHLSRGQGYGQSHEEGGEPKLSELRGSHSLAQIPDYIWMLARDPFADGDEANTTSCWLKKNRVKGKVGLMSRLQYQPGVCKFKEVFTTN